MNIEKFEIMQSVKMHDNLTVDELEIIVCMMN